MKKIFKVLLCLIMLVSICACGGQTPKKVDDKQVVIDALNKTSALNYTDMDMNISMDFMDMKIDIPMSTKIIIENGKPSSMTMDTEVLEQKTLMSYVDGYMYLQLGDTKVKAKTTIEDFMEYNGNDYYLLNEDMIKTVTKTEDGQYNITLNDEAINEYAQSMESYTGEVSTDNVTDISYTLTVNKEGYVSDFNISMKITASIEETSYDINTQVTCTYNNIGQTFEIKAPSDADTYDEMNMEDLMQ